MPELTTVHLAFFAIVCALGGVAGWFLRGDRSAREKIVINAGWQEQFELREAELERLAERNETMAGELRELQASEKDWARQSSELRASLRETTDQRDELQRQMKETRDELGRAIEQRVHVEQQLRERDSRAEHDAAAARQKDEKIFRLSRELESWQTRVPPLVEKYRHLAEELRDVRQQLAAAREELRDREALRRKLDRASERIADLESQPPPEETRIEPLDVDALGDEMVACNDQFEEEPDLDLSDLRDQIDDTEAVDADAATRGGADATGFHFGVPAEEGLDVSIGVDDAPANDEVGTLTAADSETPNHRGVLADNRDDLKEIKGVGPSIEQTLNDLGIYRFEQLAGISEYDMDRIAERLKGFRTRLYREDWIGQARALHYQKHHPTRV